MSLEIKDISGTPVPPSWAALFGAAAAAFAPLDHVLAGMLAAGLGVEALCVYLDLARQALFERILALGLALPHDRPLRRRGGKWGWTDDDVRLLIELWVDGLHARSIAQRLGRSPGGIWSKARRLGLPRRCRKHLFYLPLVPGLPVPASAAENSARSSETSAAVDSRPSRVSRPASSAAIPAIPAIFACSRVVIAASLPVSAFYSSVWDDFDLEAWEPESGREGTSPVAVPDGLENRQTQPPAGNGKRRQRKAKVRLTAKLIEEIENRGFSGQRAAAVASEMGVTMCQVATHWNNAGVTRDRSKLSNSYDEELAKTNIEALGVKRELCPGLKSQGRTFFFWRKPCDPDHRSPLWNREQRRVRPEKKGGGQEQSGEESARNKSVSLPVLRFLAGKEPLSRGERCRY